MTDETEDPRMPHLRNLERIASTAQGIIAHMDLFIDPFILLSRHVASMKAEVTEISALTREIEKRENATKPGRTNAPSNSKSHLGRPTG